MINFEKFAADGNAFVNEIAQKLGHPEEKGQTGILLRSVLPMSASFLCAGWNHA